MIASVVALFFLLLLPLLPVLFVPLQLPLPLALLQTDDDDGEMELKEAILRKCCSGLGLENGDAAPEAAVTTADMFPVGVGVLLSIGVFSVFREEELFGALLSSVLWLGSGMLVFGISLLPILFLGELVRLSCKFFRFFDFRVDSEGDEFGESRSIIFLVSLSLIVK